ncbi:hypothetical protein CC1G_05668 [Coprinopsis cinerea okayama7|uniref:Shr3 amino acid permease chaperone n=1 Tax=Coprinopsis cinerea (strain Okayama-7 / 130 / ATCC MYA-4618 / FGSC 9003) TaxID=240176 RepID=A8N9U1_COPC7|nr:hypothetical protein CC1G_05668 [Coprinopsis cinerea okayama7\|eukprot:XP_001831597.1 hypothetical protein CC1G_05668 [Coprinopsis cinerea okayama7\
MGFKEGAVLAPVSFFLGVLFICFNIDHRLLWGEVTEKVVEDGFHFYRTFFNAPPAIKTLLHSFLGVGLLGLLAKLHKWDNSAMFFDGSSVAAYVFAIAVYLGVTIPGLRTIVLPVAEVESPDVQVEALRVLAAGNIIMIACLGFVLTAQAGQEWARRSEANALAQEMQQQQQQQESVSAEEKKSQ